jgi:hypothetical protein
VWPLVGLIWLNLYAATHWAVVPTSGPLQGGCLPLRNPHSSWTITSHHPAGKQKAGFRVLWVSQQGSGRIL